MGSGSGFDGGGSTSDSGRVDHVSCDLGTLFLPANRSHTTSSLASQSCYSQRIGPARSFSPYPPHRDRATPSDRTSPHHLQRSSSAALSFHPPALLYPKPFRSLSNASIRFERSILRRSAGHALATEPPTLQQRRLPLTSPPCPTHSTHPTSLRYHRTSQRHPTSRSPQRDPDERHRRRLGQQHLWNVAFLRTPSALHAVVVR